MDPEEKCLAPKIYTPLLKYYLLTQKKDEATVKYSVKIVQYQELKYSRLLLNVRD